MPVPSTSGWYRTESTFSRQSNSPPSRPPSVRHRYTDLPNKTPPFPQYQPESIFPMFASHYSHTSNAPDPREIDQRLWEAMRTSGYERQTPPLVAKVVELVTQLPSPSTTPVSVFADPLPHMGQESPPQAPQSREVSPLTTIDLMELDGTTAPTSPSKTGRRTPQPIRIPRSSSSLHAVSGSKAPTQRNNTGGITREPSDPARGQDLTSTPLVETPRTSANSPGEDGRFRHQAIRSHNNGENAHQSGCGSPSRRRRRNSTPYVQPPYVEHRQANTDHSLSEINTAKLVQGCHAVTSQLFSALCRCPELSSEYLKRSAMMWTKMTDVFTRVQDLIRRAPSNIPAPPSWTHNHGLLLASLKRNLAKYERMTMTLPRLGMFEKRFSKIEAFRLKFLDLTMRIEVNRFLDLVIVNFIYTYMPRNPIESYSRAISEHNGEQHTCEECRWSISQILSLAPAMTAE